MEIVKIPDIFLEEDEVDTSQEIILYNYQSSVNQIKNKVSLSCNLFSFVIQGIKEVSNTNKQSQITASEFLVLKTGNCLMTEHISKNNKYNSLLLFFENKILSDFITKYKLKKTGTVTDSGFLTLNVDAFVSNYVHSLILLSQNEKVISKDLLYIKFEELMMYLLDCYGDQILNFFINNTLRNQDIHFKQIVETNISKRLTIDELAFLCNMSISTFKRRFQEFYDISPSKWFQNKRLENAKYLLDTMNYDPSEVYHKAGFENLSSFTQAFKKAYNITPKKYKSLKN